MLVEEAVSARDPLLSAMCKMLVIIADLARLVEEFAEQLEPARGGVNAQAIDSIRQRAAFIARDLRNIAETTPT